MNYSENIHRLILFFHMSVDVGYLILFKKKKKKKRYAWAVNRFFINAVIIKRTNFEVF